MFFTHRCAAGLLPLQVLLLAPPTNTCSLRHTSILQARPVSPRSWHCRARFQVRSSSLSGPWILLTPPLVSQCRQQELAWGWYRCSNNYCPLHTGVVSCCVRSTIGLLVIIYSLIRCLQAAASFARCAFFQSYCPQIRLEDHSSIWCHGVNVRQSSTCCSLLTHLNVLCWASCRMMAASSGSRWSVSWTHSWVTQSLVQERRPISPHKPQTASPYTSALQHVQFVDPESRVWMLNSLALVTHVSACACHVLHESCMTASCNAKCIHIFTHGTSRLNQPSVAVSNCSTGRIHGLVETEMASRLKTIDRARILTWRNAKIQLTFHLFHHVCLPSSTACVVMLQWHMAGSASRRSTTGCHGAVFRRGALEKALADDATLSKGSRPPSWSRWPGSR